MTDSMSRYGQAAGMMGPDAMCRPPGAGPPPPSALPSWQGCVSYGGIDPSARALGPFPQQTLAYRSQYPTFVGQYPDHYDQYLTAPLPPDYPPVINVRYPGPGDKSAGGSSGVSSSGGGGGGPPENNGNYPTASALPPFSTIAGHPVAVGPSGRGPPTPGLKDDMGEFNDGLGARLSRGGGGGGGNSGGPPTPGGGAEFVEGRLVNRGGNEENPNASPSLVQYRPWEAGSAPRGEHSGGPSSHASPTSPTSSYSFAENFLKFQPGTPSSEKGPGIPGSNNHTNNHHPGNNNRNEVGGAGVGSPGPGTHQDDKWYHGKAGGGRGEATAPSPAEKHVVCKDGSAVRASGGPATIGSKNGNDTNSGGPSQQGYGGDGSSGAEDSKHGHYPANYDGPDMMLSFGSPHPANSYDYYPPAAAPPGGGPWGYPTEVPGKVSTNYQGGGGSGQSGQQRAYNQNGRDGVYGNGSGPEQRQYQLSPHDKLAPTPTPPPPPSGYHTSGRGKGGKRGRGSRGGGGGGGSSGAHHHGMDKMGGHDEYGGPPSKQQALSGGDDPSNPGSDKPKKKKRKRCGECYGCQRKDNCGECAPCRNEKSHQICKMRRCEKLIERKPSSHHANAAAAPSQPPTPPPPPNVPNPAHLPPPHAHSPVSDKLQYLGAGGGVGGGGQASWW